MSVDLRAETCAVTDHVCRRCLSRVLNFAGRFRCSGCGVEGVGSTASVCGCGIAIGEGALKARRLFRCIPNPHPSPSCPAQIVIQFGGEGSPSDVLPGVQRQASAADGSSRASSPEEGNSLQVDNGLDAHLAGAWNNDAAASSVNAWG